MKWQLLKPDFECVRKIKDYLKCSSEISVILANRGISCESEALDFFIPRLKNLSPPFFLKDIETAVDRIVTALKNSEKILIFSDYDVDGITGATILLDFLKRAGAKVSYYIPHRQEEGYGLKPCHIEEIAIPGKIDLIITVDCGSSDSNAIKSAKSKGIDVIVTDHHNVSKPFKDVVAMVNPLRSDCRSGLDHLAGVGVAFYLLIGLRKKLRDIQFWNTDREEPNLKDYCDLVALGTIADMVPLSRENRILVKTGLKIIENGPRPGIKALLEAGKIDSSSLDSDHIPFKLAPMLNAAGRLDYASRAVDLLCSTDLKKARKIAEDLKNLNNERQIIERGILDKIESFIETNPLILQRKTFVFYHDWHQGVMGIVASKLARKYYRPVALISTKRGRGSARSIKGIDLYKILSKCESLLKRYGGHSMAAGFRIEHKKIEPFIECFERVVKDTSGPDIFIPRLNIDMELNFNRVSSFLLDDLTRLGPYGNANPMPVFMARDVKVMFSKIVGRGHRKMRLSQASNNAPLEAVQFNVEPEYRDAKSFKRIAFSLKWNHWNQQKKPQIIIKAVE